MTAEIAITTGGTEAIYAEILRPTAALILSDEVYEHIIAPADGRVRVRVHRAGVPRRMGAV